MASPTHVRFPDPIDKRLASYARQVGAKKSSVVVQALDEWLKMQAHPGIVFVTNNLGERRATLAAGPEVWTVAESWQQHKPQQRKPGIVAEAVGLTAHEVETALGYWADHREEIDEELALHIAAQEEAYEAWQRRRALDALKAS